MSKLSNKNVCVTKTSAGGEGEHHAREVELVHDPPFLPCLTYRNLLASQQCTSRFSPGDSIAHKVSCLVALQPVSSVAWLRFTSPLQPEYETGAPLADTDWDTMYHTVSNDALGRNDDGKPYS